MIFKNGARECFTSMHYVPGTFQFTLIDSCEPLDIQESGIRLEDKK